MGTRYINRKTQLLTAPQCASAKSDDAPHGVQGAHRTYRQGYLQSLEQMLLLDC